MQKFGLTLSVFFLAMFAVLAWGWVWNIVKLVGLLDGSVTAMFIARAVGVFALPLGGVLGYF